MTKVSSISGSSWISSINEAFRGPSPISLFNRIAFRDQTCFFDRVWNVELSKDDLRKRIQVCKEKAGIRGEKYPPVLEAWKKDIVSLAQGVHQTGDKSQLPSKASPKNELVYNHDLAEAATNVELEALSPRLSTYTTLLLIHTYFGPGKNVDSSVIFELIAKSESNPQKDVLALYIDHFGKKMRWGVAQRVGLRCSYWIFSGVVSGIIHTVCQKVLAELRLSTRGKIEPIFEALLDRLEKFLKDYRGEKPLEDFTEKKNLATLCRELSPLLVKGFFPRKIGFFKIMFKKIPFMSLPALALDSTIGVVFNGIVRLSLRRYLPGILQGISASAIEGLTAKKETESQTPINYQIAIPFFRLINDKLVGFSTMLLEPPLEVDEPPPPRMATKLEGVIDELMKLSTKPSKDAQVREGLRNGLINGGYQLMKYWQKEQESILHQFLILGSLPFTESQESSDCEADRKEFESLWKKQGKLVEDVTEKVFELEVRKEIAGTPSSQVRHHLSKKHSEIKRYLEEGFSDIIGLRSSLKKAKTEIASANYKGFDVVLNKHLIFWEEFLSLMKSSTRKHYPKPANDILFREFYPLCQEATKQVDRISGLQDDWILYTRHKELKQYFLEMEKLFDLKRAQDVNLLSIQGILNKIEVLLPPNPPEVQVVKRFVESFSEMKKTEELLKDLLNIKAILKKQAKGVVEEEGIETLKGLLSRHPELQKDRNFVSLLKKYIAASQSDMGSMTLSKETMLQGITKFVEQELQTKTQHLKDLQLNLLHRIEPTKPVSSFKVPCSTTLLLKEMTRWIQTRKKGYEILETGNLKELQSGINDLEKHVETLEAKVHKMQPHALYFPLESVLDVASLACGGLTKVPYVSRLKEHLIQDLNGILAGVTRLVAEPEGGKRNLYSWVERLALYETLKYLKSKDND